MQMNLQSFQYEFLKDTSTFDHLITIEFKKFITDLQQIQETLDDCSDFHQIHSATSYMTYLSQIDAVSDNVNGDNRDCSVQDHIGSELCSTSFLESWIFQKTDLLFTTSLEMNKVMCLLLQMIINVCL